MDGTYLFGITVVPLDFALAATVSVLLHFHLSTDLVTFLGVDGALTKKNLEKNKGNTK